MGRIAGIPPTREMRINAQQGLNLYGEFGRGESKHRLIRAHEIAKGEPLQENDWRAIAGWHARNWGDSDPQILQEYPDGGPDAKYIAAMLLGGDAGREKAFNLIPELNRN